MHLQLVLADQNVSKAACTVLAQEDISQAIKCSNVHRLGQIWSIGQNLAIEGGQLLLDVTTASGSEG